MHLVPTPEHPPHQTGADEPRRPAIRIRRASAVGKFVFAAEGDVARKALIEGRARLIAQHLAGLAHVERAAEGAPHRVAALAVDHLQTGADVVVVGEVENVLTRLLECLDNEDFGHVLSSPNKADMTYSAPPRWDLLDMQSYMTLPVQFIRGCPFHCEFCDATALMGKAARSKTIQNVIDELQRLYDLGWRGEVSFVDDNIIGNIKRVKELCRVLIPWMRERGYPFEFITQTSLNLAQKKISSN